MEILATRAPPQLQECLAVYKHGQSGEWGSRGWKGTQGTVPSSPAISPGQLSGILSAHVLFPGALSPSSTLRPSSPQSPQGRRPDVIIKEGEATISHLRLGLQGRFRDNDDWGSVAVPRVPLSSSQPLLMHPGLSGILLQLEGEAGTCFLSHRCHLPGPWQVAGLGCHIPPHR